MKWRKVNCLNLKSAIINIKKAHALAYNNKMQLREIKEELAAAKVEIARLRDQLVRAQPFEIVPLPMAM